MLIAVFIIAFLIRLIAIDQSLWLDEATTAKVVMRVAYSDIIPQFSRFDFHPPLYYYFMKTWTNLAGSSEIALRFPSIIFSLLTGFVIYHIGKHLKDTKTGMWAAIFFLFNPLIIYYSQEARMYMMVTFFLTTAFYFYLKLLSEKTISAKTVIVENIFQFLSFMTFYGSIFFISAMYVWLLYKRKFKLFFLIYPGFHIAVAVLSPLLYLQFLNARETLTMVTNWSLVLGTVTIKNLLLIPLKFSIGRISFDPKYAYYAIAGIWTAVVFFVASRGARKKPVLLYFFVYPIALAIIFSFMTPLLQYFRFVYLIPILSLLLASGAGNLRQRYILAFGFVIFALIYLFFPQYHREDWKSLSKRITTDKPVYIIPSFSDPLLYYKPDLTIKDLRTLTEFSPQEELIIFPYGEAIYGIDHAKVLQQKGYVKYDERSERGVSVIFYTLSTRQSP